MAVFSTNQVRQMYVVSACKTSNAGVQSAFANVGDLQVKKQDDALYFLYKGVDGVMKSDLIPLKNITYAKAIDAANLTTKMRKISIALDANINDGAPIAGQIYELGINFKNFFALGDDSQYYKDAAVKATASMTASDFYKEFVKALNRNFSREVGASKTVNPYLTFKIGYSDSSESVEGDANWASATATKIIIEEKEQEWKLGVKKQHRVMFDVFPSTIYTGGDDVIWAAKVGEKYFTEMTSTTVLGNGKNIADLEWFCMGERGDQYRMVGYPNYIPTEYLVDSSKQYHVIEIHYAFTDSGTGSYRSEKDLTIVVPKGESTANYTEVNKVIAAINYFDANLLTVLS